MPEPQVELTWSMQEAKHYIATTAYLGYIICAMTAIS